MPYEIDYALLSYIQLKKSRYYLPDDVEIEIDTVMNMLITKSFITMA